MNEANHPPNPEEQVERTNPSESPGVNSPASPSVRDLGETRVKLWGKYGLKIPALIAVILWLLGAGF